MQGTGVSREGRCGADEHEAGVDPQTSSVTRQEKQRYLLIAGGKLVKRDQVRDDPALSFMGYLKDFKDMISVLYRL